MSEDERRSGIQFIAPSKPTRFYGRMVPHQVTKPGKGLRRTMMKSACVVVIPTRMRSSPVHPKAELKRPRKIARWPDHRANLVVSGYHEQWAVFPVPMCPARLKYPSVWMTFGKVIV